MSTDTKTPTRFSEYPEAFRELCADQCRVGDAETVRAWIAMAAPIWNASALASRATIARYRAALERITTISARSHKKAQEIAWEALKESDSRGE